MSVGKESRREAVSFMTSSDIKEEEEPLFSKQVFAAASVSLLSATMGALFAFSGVVGPQLTRSALQLDQILNNSLAKNGTFENKEQDELLLSDSQLSWFASLIVLGLIPSSIFGGYISHHGGRIRALRMMTPFIVLSLAAQTLAHNVQVLLAARLAQGVTIGLIGVPASVYIAEISSVRWRTTLLSTMDLFIKLGNLFAFVLGSIVHWRLLAFTMTALPLVSLVCFWFILPESPVWFIHQGRVDEALKSLKWFHPNLASAQRELDLLLQSPTILKNSQKPSGSASNLSSLRALLVQKLAFMKCVFLRKDVYHPFALLLLLFLLQQLSGRVAISFYAVAVLADTAKSFNEYFATILFGLTALVGQVLNSSLLLVLRRRVLLAISSFVMAISMLTLSLVTKEEQNEDNVTSTIALISILAAGIGYQFGLGPMPWALSSELYPSDVRSLLSGFTQACAQTLMFLVVKTFPGMRNAFGLSSVFACFALSCAMAFVFAITLLPETKNVRLEQIAAVFGKGKSEDDKEEDVHA